MPRLFVATWPSADVVATLRALERPAIDGIRWTTEDQWHVTLKFLGETDLDEATTSFKRVRAVRTLAIMGPATAKLGKGIVQVPVQGLGDTAAAVGDALGRDERPFRGHLTLARARERRGVDLRPLIGVPLAGEWPVDEITLVASELHPTGARYQTVATLPLR